MSILCMVMVFNHSRSKANDRLILLAIADEADDSGGNAFPSMRRLAMKANCNKDTVSEAIKRLESSGELLVDRPLARGPGQFNRYRINLELYGNPGQTQSVISGGFIYGSVRTSPDNYLSRPDNSKSGGTS